MVRRSRTQLLPNATSTRYAPHVRDGISVGRVMWCVVLALLPVVLMSLYNTGYQANAAMAKLDIGSAQGWRGAVLDMFRIDYDAASVGASIAHGLLYFLPLYLVTVVVGDLWQRLFAVVRGRDITEGFMVTALLFTLCLPPVIPLWQVALGISFGVVIGKELFGGTGKNFLNPALTGLAFLYITYPDSMSGDAVWTAVDGYTGATALSLAASGGLAAIGADGTTWLDAFIGRIPGSLGETSALACMLGAAFLLYTRVASWRIMLGALAGMIAAVQLFNAIGEGVNPVFTVPWYWHFVLGSFAFGAVFLATDPVSAASTDAGRWMYGVLVGVMTIVIRVGNPSQAEGVMFAILLGNIFAPLIDYLVMRANIRRRVRRGG